MTRHFIGYGDAIDRVMKMDLPDLLHLLDDLFGRDALRYGDDVEAVRREALRQLEIEWRDPGSKY